MQADVFNEVTFGHRLRQARKDAGLSQADLAERIGVQQPWISEMEHGRQGPVSANTLLHLARALGVSTEYLLGLSDAQVARPTPRRRKKAEQKNTAALAMLEQWYATPDDQPPGSWDALEAAIQAHVLQFGDEDTPPS